jgi:hypothetical protein
MPVSSVSDVAPEAVDNVSRSFRVNDGAIRVVQELQPNGRWTVRAELPAGAIGRSGRSVSPGMLVVATHPRDRQA